MPYARKMMRLLEGFEQVTMMHLPRKRNAHADSLATIAAKFQISIAAERGEMVILRQREATNFSSEDLSIVEESLAVDEVLAPWYIEIQNFLDKDTLPILRKDAKSVPETFSF